MGPGVWWLGWAMVAICWIAYLSSREFDWMPVAIGAITGMTLATWAIEITGNKVPDSWRNGVSRLGRAAPYEKRVDERSNLRR